MRASMRASSSLKAAGSKIAADVRGPRDQIVEALIQLLAHGSSRRCRF